MEGGDIGIGGGGGGRFFFRLLHLVISTGTCFSFLPALRQLSARRRHFEVFIGVFQLLSAVMYSGCDALAMRSASLVQTDDNNSSPAAQGPRLSLRNTIAIRRNSNRDTALLQRLADSAATEVARADGGDGSGGGSGDGSGGREKDNTNTDDIAREDRSGTSTIL